MLASLRHGAVSSGHYKDSAVHLGSTSNHVLNVVSVTGAVNVCVVTLCSLVFNVSSRNGNTTLTFLGGTVNLIVSTGFSHTAVCKNLSNCSGKRSLAMVNVTDRTHVHVGLGALE